MPFFEKRQNLPAGVTGFGSAGAGIAGLGGVAGAAGAGVADLGGATAGVVGLGGGGLLAGTAGVAGTAGIGCLGSCLVGACLGSGSAAPVKVRAAVAKRARGRKTRIVLVFFGWFLVALVLCLVGFVCSVGGVRICCCWGVKLLLRLTTIQVMLKI